jgi:hypothetical protein
LSIHGLSYQSLQNIRFYLFQVKVRTYKVSNMEAPEVVLGEEMEL